MNKASSIKWSWLAWARWKMKIPAHWRPLRVENRDSKARFTIGDSTQATVQIKWWNPPSKGFDVSRWLDRRLRSMGRRVTVADHAPASERFDRTLWLPEARTRKGAVSSIWYGYASRARLVLEVVVNGGASPEAQELAQTLVLPSLDVSPADAPTRWAVYDTRFESPPGYELQDSRLNLGAITLHLRKGKQRLMLCQVYPATAALAKKPMAEWLDISALKGKWQPQSTNGVEELQVGPFQALRRANTRRRPFPLGGLVRRHCVGVVAHDESLNRLLLAEHISPVAREAGVVSEAIRSMNWACPEGDPS